MEMVRAEGMLAGHLQEQWARAEMRMEPSPLALLGKPRFCLWQQEKKACHTFKYGVVVGLAPGTCWGKQQAAPGFPSSPCVVLGNGTVDRKWTRALKDCKTH